MHHPSKRMAGTRVYSPRHGGHQVRVQPGEYYVTSHPNELIVTILGSCVAACVRNPLTGFGGVNHFMLPASELGDWGGVLAHMRFGNHAMEVLINEVLKSGCQRHQLEIKLFGGGAMYEGSSDVGAKNGQFAIEYLKQENLFLLAADLGGKFGRRIEYAPATGKVQRLLLTGNQDAGLSRAEREYRKRIDHEPVGGDIELFD